ncbi:hypothetical protein HYS50_01885 [Candidatus Woesearchaeota archaeon]|nr:hypothetical protein [Candidatus Woesearchaeota archaeon]
MTKVGSRYAENLLSIIARLQEARIRENNSRGPLEKCYYPSRCNPREMPLIEVSFLEGKRRHMYFFHHSCYHALLDEYQRRN